MKKGWQTKTLGETCEMYQPKTISGKEMVADGAYPVFGANGVIGRYNQFNHEEPQLLITCRGATCGSVNISEPRSWVTGNAMVVRPKSESLAMRYLEYLFRGGIDISKAITGSAQPQITRTNLEPLEISYPESLAEQQRIVALLDKAFAGLATAKANAERNLQNARAIFESHLQSVFTERGEGWMEKRLGDLSRINYGYTESASNEKVGPHFLRITDIQDNGVDWDTVPYCPIDARTLPKYKLLDGDIVFARTGASTGKSYLVKNPPESVFASYLIRVQLSNKEFLPQFVNLFFQTSLYWDTIRAGVSGSAQGGFNATKLGELVIPFPKSSNEQKSVVAHLDELAEETKHLTRLYERKLTALEELKKSLLHQAFNGEL
jgi:type I restriction enzyme S subunit